MLDAPLPLHSCPPGRSHHLAAPVYEVQSRVHGPPPLRSPLSPDAASSGPRCPVGDPWGPQFGTLRHHLSHLAHGPLSPSLCNRPPESGDGADTVWAAAADLLLG